MTKLTVLVVSSVGILVIGSWVIAYGLYLMRKATSAIGWPQVSGTINKIELSENLHSDGDLYMVRVTYRYLVENVDFEGKTIYFGYSGSSNKLRETRLYEKLREHADSLGVYYDPKDPRISCVVTGIRSGQLFLIVFAIIAMLFCEGIVSLVWLVN